MESGEAVAAFGDSLARFVFALRASSRRDWRLAGLPGIEPWSKSQGAIEPGEFKEKVNGSIYWQFTHSFDPSAGIWNLTGVQMSTFYP
jgi:hypothetical protein